MADIHADIQKPGANLRKFLIPSLAAAGFVTQANAELPLVPSHRQDDPDLSNFTQRLTLDHEFTLARHRSHSSHRSHRSHSSHRSSSGGGYSGYSGQSYTAPRPSQAPATPYVPPSRLYGTPNQTNPSGGSTGSSGQTNQQRSAPLKTLPGNSEKFSEIVRKVQLALMSYGYYNGAIDGIVGPECRAALSRFQTDYSLKVTGTITPEVLNTFGITAR